MKRSSWKYLRFRHLQTRIEGYGYHYSFSRYASMLAAGSAAVIGIGKLNGLETVFIGILMVALLGVIPILVLKQFAYLYDQNRFQDLVRYMEQMIYSFQKHPKIISGLEETEGLLDGEIQLQVRKVRERIEMSQAITYKEAFYPIEGAYPCERLMEMHDFFIKVEEIGGEYQNALAAILEDLKMWTERTYLFQRERSQMKKKIIWSILCVMLLCSVLFRLMAGSLEMMKTMDSFFYQMGTTGILLGFLCLFVFSQCALTGTWLKRPKEISKEQIQKDWSHIKEAPGQYQRAQKRLQREVEKQFPRWLRTMILGLQTDNVYRAIVESADDAPYVLKLPLEILIEELKEDPVSMRPYDHFLKELQVPGIHSAVKMLYAYTNTGTEEAKEQLGQIIKQNIQLTDRAERIQNEDEIARYFMLFYVPMFLGTAKIMLDMSMLFLVMFSLWGKMY